MLALKLSFFCMDETTLEKYAASFSLNFAKLLQFYNLNLNLPRGGSSLGFRGSVDLRPPVIFEPSLRILC